MKKLNLLSGVVVVDSKEVVNEKGRALFLLLEHPNKKQSVCYRPIVQRKDKANDQPANELHTKSGNVYTNARLLPQHTAKYAQEIYMKGF